MAKTIPGFYNVATNLNQMNKTISAPPTSEIFLH